jgi:hypothetical protein
MCPPCTRRESEADGGRARTAEPRHSPANGGGQRERILVAPMNPGARRERLLQAHDTARLLAPPGAARLLASPGADPGRRAWRRPTRRDKAAMGIPRGRGGERWEGPTRSSPDLHPLDWQVILGGQVAFSPN